MKKMIRIVLRHVNETEEWLAVATNYCTFKNGRDKRGRGHGATAIELKAAEKAILAKFKTIELCRQWLAGQKEILIIAQGQHINLRVGHDENTFSRIIEEAYYRTSNWKSEENICTFVGTMSDAKAYVKVHEGFIAGPYILR